MDFFKEVLVPLAINTIVIWLIMSVFAILLYNKIIPDKEKRNKIITGYLFITISIVLTLVITIFSFS